MAINLTKGQGISLEKSLNKVKIGLAWDGGQDADVSAAALKGADAATKKFVTDSHFIFYNNKTSPEGAITHSGDARSGAAVKGDDETIIVDLTKLPAETTEVAIIATIHDGKGKGLDWSKLHAVATLYNDETGAVLATYALGTDYVGMIGVQPVSLYRTETGTWKFTALGAGYDFGLEPFVAKWQN